MIVLNCEQGTTAWLEARRAIPTSSCFSKILTANGTLSSGWDNYMNKLLAEYIDPESSVEERVYTKDMKRGNEQEPEARQSFEFISGHVVSEVGGLYLDEEKQSLCSPDGLIHGINSGFEVKCPKLSTHIGWIRKGKLPTQHTIQVQSGMAFSDFSSWVFMSYHRKYKEFILTVDRNEKLIRTIKKTLCYFIAELNQLKAEIDKTKQEF